MSSSLLHSPSILYETLMAEYEYGHKRYYWQEVCNSPLILSFRDKGSPQTYIVNVGLKKVVEMVGNDGYVRIFSERDVDFRAIAPQHVEQVRVGYAPYGICVSGFNKDGVSLIRWGVGESENGTVVHTVDSYVDIDFRLIMPFQTLSDPYADHWRRWVAYQRLAIKDKKSIWD